tara:strand:- start:2591 stop:3184 length:594 start_codon:yes stop_codon:yes gene_type:complete
MKNNTFCNDNDSANNAIEFLQSSYADGIRDLVLNVTEFGTNTDGISQIDPAYCNEFIDEAGITIADDIVTELTSLMGFTDDKDPVREFIGYCIDVANNIDEIGAQAELNSVDIGDTTTDVVDLTDVVSERAELNAEPLFIDDKDEFKLIVIEDEAIAVPSHYPDDIASFTDLENFRRWDSMTDEDREFVNQIASQVL